MTFVCALKAEAAPLIDHFGLKLSSKTPFLRYENGSVRLLVSGIGRLRAAAATSALLACDDIDLQQPLINFGLCGAKHAEIGALFSIRKVVDAPTQKVYHLPMHEACDAATLTTFDHAIEEAREIKTDLVDMEASGFLAAATLYRPLRSLRICKVVSDRLHDRQPTPEEIEVLIRPHLRSLERLG